tara:strand:+ start:2130 stop:3872 length:1743 start_codon:yes stop_codon:yes gene_type:complete
LKPPICISGVTSPASSLPDHDYIVVGGGAAGCVLANRLSARPSNRVLLIEAGRDFEPGTEPETIRDTFYTAAYVDENLWPDTRVRWLEPRDGEAAHTESFYEQGRVMGGGSSVNAMVALRGLKEDFDDWVAAGATGWSWDDVLPHYRRLERDLDFRNNNHGSDGPIPVRRHRREDWPPFVKAVAQELAARGHLYVDDVNGSGRAGVGRVPMSNLETQRVSAAMGYLDTKVRHRPNLTILPETTVVRIITENRRATGVEIERNGQSENVTASNVVVTAGALRSPVLLMRSGIGPGDELTGLGIDVHADVPGVGRNLHDHPTFAAAAHLKRSARQIPYLRPHANAGLFFSSGLEGCPPLDMYMPIANKVGWHAVGEQIGGLFVVIMRPFSRGRISLLSPHDQDLPSIRYDAFGDTRDLERAKTGMRFAAELLRQPGISALATHCFGGSFTHHIRQLSTYTKTNALRSSVGAALLDGPAPLRDWLMRHVVAGDTELDSLVADDATLEAWLRDNITGFFHPVGTCRMGAPDDPNTVVDTAGRVRGVGGLRVADASIMPVIVRATTNLTAIMIGEKIAEDILRQT